MREDLDFWLLLKNSLWCWLHPHMEISSPASAPGGCPTGSYIPRDLSVIVIHPVAHLPSSKARVVVQLKVTWGLSRFCVHFSLYEVGCGGQMLSLLLPKTSSPVYLLAISFKRYQKLVDPGLSQWWQVHPLASTWTRADMWHRPSTWVEAECWMIRETSPRPRAETWEIDTSHLVWSSGCWFAKLMGSGWADTLRGAEGEDGRRLTLKSPCQDFLFDIISIFITGWMVYTLVPVSSVQ